jgi:hypothetical protein
LRIFFFNSSAFRFSILLTVLNCWRVWRKKLCSLKPLCVEICFYEAQIEVRGKWSCRGWQEEKKPQRVSGREREREREICVLERGIWGKEWQCKRKCKGVQRIVVGEESCRAEKGELQCDCQLSFEGEKKNILNTLALLRTVYFFSLVLLSPFPVDQEPTLILLLRLPCLCYVVLAFCRQGFSAEIVAKRDKSLGRVLDLPRTVGRFKCFLHSVSAAAALERIRQSCSLRHCVVLQRQQQYQLCKRALHRAYCTSI